MDKLQQTNAQPGPAEARQEGKSFSRLKRFSLPVDVTIGAEPATKNQVRIDQLAREHTLSWEDFRLLLTTMTPEDEDWLYSRARQLRELYYGKEVYLRGLIEFTNYCRNNCRYCGIRRDNHHLSRYRLSREQILDCTDKGYQLGFRTFVLQGGEDLSYSDDDICQIVSQIKAQHQDCAITLSIGEKSRESYQRYFDAGAERYLLRQETSNPDHYAYLHPKELSIANRKRCLRDLKEIGYAVGCGIMVGSPHQTVDHVIKDQYYMRELGPHMIGIGPFLPHCDTPFKNEPSGSIERCLNLIAILRLMFPHSLIPSTTALASISPTGRERGILAGANVVMPNLSPENVRSLYSLYNGKLSTGSEAAQAKEELSSLMKSIGYEVVTDIGNVKK